MLQVLEIQSHFQFFIANFSNRDFWQIHADTAVCDTKTKPKNGEK